MQTLHTLLHAAQTLAHAHPVAIHRATQAVYWIVKGAGALRTLDWAWNKYVRPEDKKSEQIQEKKAA
jgi:hypothetical protein